MENLEENIELLWMIGSKMIKYYHVKILRILFSINAKQWMPISIKDLLVFPINYQEWITYLIAFVVQLVELQQIGIQRLSVLVFYFSTERLDKISTIYTVT